MSRAIRCFHISSGLNVNFYKSKVFSIVVCEKETRTSTRIIGCNIAQLAIYYLGPAEGNIALKKYWNHTNDQFQSKHSICKSKTLSFGDHLTLVKAILGSPPIYYFSLFKALLWNIDSLKNFGEIYIGVEVRVNQISSRLLKIRHVHPKKKMGFKLDNLGPSIRLYQPIGGDIFILKKTVSSANQ